MRPQDFDRRDERGLIKFRKKFISQTNELCPPPPHPHNYKLVRIWGVLKIK